MAGDSEILHLLPRGTYASLAHNRRFAKEHLEGTWSCSGGEGGAWGTWGAWFLAFVGFLSSLLGELEALEPAAGEAIPSGINRSLHFCWQLWEATESSPSA